MLCFFVLISVMSFPFFFPPTLLHVPILLIDAVFIQ